MKQDIKGAEWITFKTSGHKKTHYTAILVSCADRTKLPILLILKQKTKVKFCEEFFFHVHFKGWINKNRLKSWLRKVWAKHPDGILKKPAFLVCNQCRAHTTEAI